MAFSRRTSRFADLERRGPDLFDFTEGCDENATSNPSQMLVIFTLIFGFACLVFLRWFANMPHAPAAQEEPHDETVVMNNNPGADTV